MKDAKVTQTEAKDQNGFLSSLHSLISHVKKLKNPKQQEKIKVVLLSQYGFQRTMVVFTL